METRPTPIKHGAKQPEKTCEMLASDEKMSRTLSPLRLVGGSLLPYVPWAEGTNDDDGVMNALLC